jgi:hypothetical protein
MMSACMAILAGTVSRVNSQKALGITGIPESYVAAVCLYLFNTMFGASRHSAALCPLLTLVQHSDGSA